jgi:hypothetical protein
LNPKTASEKELRSAGKDAYDNIFTRKRQKAINDYHSMNDDLQKRIVAYNKGNAFADDSYDVLIKAQKDIAKVQAKHLMALRSIVPYEFHK